MCPGAAISHKQLRCHRVDVSHHNRANNWALTGTTILLQGKVHFECFQTWKDRSIIPPRKHPENHTIDPHLVKFWGLPMPHQHTILYVPSEASRRSHASDSFHRDRAAPEKNWHRPGCQSPNSPPKSCLKMRTRKKSGTKWLENGWKMDARNELVEMPLKEPQTLNINLYKSDVFLWALPFETLKM